MATAARTTTTTTTAISPAYYAYVAGAACNFTRTWQAARVEFAMQKLSQLLPDKRTMSLRFFFFLLLLSVTCVNYEFRKKLQQRGGGEVPDSERARERRSVPGIALAEHAPHTLRKWLKLYVKVHDIW